MLRSPLTRCHVRTGVPRSNRRPAWHAPQRGPTPLLHKLLLSQTAPLPMPCALQVDDLRGTPLSVGTLEEMIDENHAIVSSAGAVA